MKPTSAQRGSPRRKPVPGWWEKAEDEPDDTADSAESLAYKAAMNAYPKCACGQRLWAPQSQASGVCEGCRRRGTGAK